MASAVVSLSSSASVPTASKAASVGAKIVKVPTKQIINMANDSLNYGYLDLASNIRKRQKDKHIHYLTSTIQVTLKQICIYKRMYCCASICTFTAREYGYRL
jgi:hypothetical protein